MKVIDFGRGARGILLEPHKYWSESICSLNRRRLERQGISEEVIQIVLRGIKRISELYPDPMDDEYREMMDDER